MTTDLLYKGLAAPAAATPRRAVKLAPEGIVTAIVAVTGVVDAVDDLIVPGAFAYTLSVRRPKVVDDHEWKRKAGRVLHVEEWLPGDPRLPKKTKDGRPWPAAAGALVATMQYNLRSTVGADSYEWVRFYAETNEAEFSIGYKVPDGKARKRADGVRVILMVDLFEFSHVLFGAAPLSMALEVKSVSSGSGGAVTRPALTEAEETDDDDTPAPKAKPWKKPWEDDDEDRASMESKTAAAVLLEAKGQAPRRVETKTVEVKSHSRMKGSYEERIAMLECAARDLMATALNAPAEDVCVCTIATYANEAVFSVWVAGEQESYLIPYTADEDGGLDLGEPQKVELSLVAEPETDDEEPGVVDAESFGQYVAAKFDALRAGTEGKGQPAPEDLPEGTITADNLPDGKWAEYRKTEPIRAMHMDGPFTVQTREGVVESDGGWLALDSDDQPYPIAEDEFDNVYEPVKGDGDGDEPVDAGDTDGDDDEGDEPPVDAGDTDGDDEDEETVTVDPNEHFNLMDELGAASRSDEDEDAA